MVRYSVIYTNNNKKEEEGGGGELCGSPQNPLWSLIIQSLFLKHLIVLFISSKTI